MKPIRVAVIGCGVIAPLHIECYQALNQVEVTWLCDLDPEKASRLARQFAVGQTTTDAAEVFRAPDVDAVSICTDHASHADLAIAALRQGKDVLCEKALTQNAETLQRLLDAAGEFPERVVGGVFQHRFDPVNREVRAILAEGLLGTLLTATMQLRCFRSNEYYARDAWRGTWKTEGGSVLINQAIHFIDQLLWITGGMDRAAAMIANLTHRNAIETEDTAAAVLKLKCGAIGTLTATASSHLGWEALLAFHGTDGALEIHNDKIARVSFKDPAVEDAVRARLDQAGTPRGAQAGKGYYGTGHPAQIADFIDAVRERRPPFVTLESAAETVRAVFDIYRAAGVAPGAAT